MEDPAILLSGSVESLIKAALIEDAPWGDITTETLVPPDAPAEAALVARESGVFCGGSVFAAVVQASSAVSERQLLVADGSQFVGGQTLAVVRAPARSLLLAERVALNFAQRMTAVATITKKFVDSVAGTNARIVDTRKTTPGLRALEKYAVLCGGGTNHRFSLSDAVLVKDNHLAVMRDHGIDVAESLRALRKRVPFTAHIEVEVDNLDQIAEVLESEVVDSILVDNFALIDMRRAVELVNGSALVNASGGVTLETVRDIALTGVDLISVGRLTLGCPPVDLGLDFDIAR